MEHSLLYTTLAEYYDTIYERYLTQVVPQIVEFAEKVFMKEATRKVVDILDLACGTGGPTLKLSERGYCVTGLDLSYKMLKVMARKLGSPEMRVGIVQGDVRKLPFSRERFDAVTMFFTSINYMVSEEDLLALFRQILDVLRPGGVFLADSPNPFLMNRQEFNRPVAWSVRRGEEEIFMLNYRERGEESSIIYFNKVIFIGKQGELPRFYHVRDRIRLYTADEYKLYVQAAGFTFCKIYKGFELDEDIKGAKRIVIVARK